VRCPVCTSCLWHPEIAKSPSHSCAFARLNETLTAPMKGFPLSTQEPDTCPSNSWRNFAQIAHPPGAYSCGGTALAARALALGEDIEYSGPIYNEIKIDGSKITLRFTHLGGGLVAKDGPLTGFTIAGSDRKFVNAEAEIQDDKVVVWSTQVAQPVAVRYGWANYPTGNLWNKAGLPASPFRTDDFPMLTGPKKTASASRSGTR
jgi:hypothetical protein